ncbi:MAG: 16S rRNA (adenine(1518)-N(6)/adenine(1519)-N(6))-dimethyltransferase RsmA [Candidatus Marsarchaeota archaeon]|jgi:16S rRNA (adenine1518-N6/adenine1519-N6)-dimethyltransferase|nr:16S rRNA (adenine(1518)-N(6)/adenine(1519)-N(6))-dimethyltransferase RsmA [Candidatus Marsarchaeota archaeon]
MKQLGQSFLVNRDIAIAEAEHAHGKIVLEIGPGRGILTEELVRNAKKVIAVEKDYLLFRALASTMPEKNLKLIHGDFFEIAPDDLELDKVEILIANIPYYISSRVIAWAWEHRMQAVLCLQKEFVKHMLAKEGTGGYSRLSVMCSLMLSITEIMPVDRGNFSPIPKVDSEVIYIKPREVKVSSRESELINLLMQHKKKRVRNAILDSHRQLGIDKKRLFEIAERIGKKDVRIFKLGPQAILELARELDAMLSSS